MTNFTSNETIKYTVPTKQLLVFISNKDLYKHVNKVIDSVRATLEKTEDALYKNSVDPFSALFDSMCQGISISKWLKQEKNRQNQKTLQNAMGTFHQDIIGSINGWKNLVRNSIIDVVSEQKKIIAEIRNKHNTTKGNHKTAIYDDLEHQLTESYPGYTGYYVEIIPKNKKTYNKPFTPSDNNTSTRRPENKSIRVIDGKSFYELATGNPDALTKLYSVLPKVISDVLGISQPSGVQDPAFKDLFDRVY